ncbi:MAG: hypothetical protein AAGD96_20220 [Chloroflexota bacterium]
MIKRAWVLQPIFWLILAYAGLGCTRQERLPAQITEVRRTTENTQIISDGNQIVLSITVFILDDHEQVFSSGRTAEEVLKIQDEVNDIWQQANIYFEVDEIRRVAVPIDITAHVIRREVDEFFQAIAQESDVFSTESQISGFYVQTLKGDNGLHPVGYPVFFVADETFNNSARAVAHETGHILGLDHTHNAPERLMHSGTNGTLLTKEEIILARRTASQLK